MLKSIENEMAKKAYECVLEIKNSKNKYDAPKYKSHVKRLPVLIQNNGLLSAIMFYKSKKDETLDKLLEHLKDWIGFRYKDVLNNSQNVKDLPEFIMGIIESGNIEVLFRIQKELIRFLTWLKMFSEAEISDEEENE